ncbi:hypothetical protein MARSALSMR5_04261 (plasmid) [Marinobacter salarius]|uniref:Uncharacterized protein n=1 Tax=Marinobacter salarius TaxID=1420917 RepID=A0A1W6KFS9_9GAMM|nr:hypothetical protein MARSALSMR5_04261 [Marinobacter salarius]
MEARLPLQSLLLHLKLRNLFINLRHPRSINTIVGILGFLSINDTSNNPVFVKSFDFTNGSQIIFRNLTSFTPATNSLAARSNCFTDFLI